MSDRQNRSGSTMRQGARQEGLQGGLPGAGRQRDEAPRRRRRWPWRLALALVAGLPAAALLAGLIVLVALSLSGRSVTMPASLTARLQERLNSEMPQGHVAISRTEFSVTPEGQPRIGLVDLALRDASGLDIARVHRVGVVLWPGDVLRGRFSPKEVSLSGAEITLRRRADGTFDLAFGAGAGASGNLAGLLDAIDAALAAGPLAATARMRADDLTITLEDARSGRLWQVTDGRLELTQSDKVVDITVNFDVFNQTEELAEVVLGFRTDKASPVASISATFRNAAATDIAAQSPLLAFLGVLDAPISGALRSAINARGEVSELAGTLEMGPGALSPSPGARPVRFDLAKVYLEYDQERRRLDFPNIELRADLAEVAGSGSLHLGATDGGWPEALVGQFRVNEARIRGGEVFAGDVGIDEGAADFRLHLSPFVLELGQVAVVQAGRRFAVSGTISADAAGWSLALDGTAPEVGQQQGLALWPLKLAPRARAWVARNVRAGQLQNVQAAFRLSPGSEPRVTFEAGFRDFSANLVRQMAPVEDATGYFVFRDHTFLMVSEGGRIPAPRGGDIAVAGTVFRVANTRLKPATAVVDMQAAGPLTAFLELLDAEPFRVLKNTALGPDMATGQVSASGRMEFVMRRGIKPRDVAYSARALVRDVRSEVLVPGHLLRADEIEVETDNSQITVSGAVRIGKASGRGHWRAALGEGADGTSRLEARLDLNPALLDEFDIALPEGSLRGQGAGQLVIDFARDQAPTYRLQSDLAGLALAIPEVGWRKPAARAGALELVGHVGRPLTVERLALSAPGLSLRGQVDLAPGGGFRQAVLERVRVGGWLDAPVTLASQGPGRALAITVSGGTLDLRRARFGTGAGGGGRGSAPIDLTLERLIISEGITLNAVSGAFDRQGGLRGTFGARVNGGPRIRGVVAPQAHGTAVRITSADAGAVLAAAHVFKTARGGDMTLILVPREGDGVYDGDLTITDVRAVRASALAELLSAISVVGLLEQLQAEGILFQEVRARFRMTPEKVVVSEGSAVGASLGVSMDGTYHLKDDELDFAGVISPIYLLNGIGEILTRKGEGLIGFTYTIKGSAQAPKISVNPLSLFTPGMFRELFRRPPPELPE